MPFLKSLVAGAFLTCACVSSYAQDAQQILEGARLAASLTNLDNGLQGNLTKDGKFTPVALFLKPQNIQFQFSESGSPWRVFHMRLNDTAYDLFEITNGNTAKFPAGKLTQAIANTDLTYEDLAFRFFYWPSPKLEGEEEVNGQPCYKLRLTKPKSDEGRYNAVYLWVHKKFGAFMQIRGHDKSGGLVKEFQVEDVMKVGDNLWTLRKMQVATHDPKTNRRISITDVVFDPPKRTRPKGLR